MSDEEKNFEVPSISKFTLEEKIAFVMDLLMQSSWSIDKFEGVQVISSNIFPLFYMDSPDLVREMFELDNDEIEHFMLVLGSFVTLLPELLKCVITMDIDVSKKLTAHIKHILKYGYTIDKGDNV